MVNFLVGYLIVSLCSIPVIIYMINTAPTVNDDEYK